MLGNDRLEVVNILGNDFSEKSLVALSQALADNKALKLIVLKIGSINCDKSAFIKFINNGFMVSTRLKYLYVNTPHYAEPINKQIGETFLPKLYIVTEKYEEKVDNDLLLNFLCQVVENQLFEGANTKAVYQFGERLLRKLIKDNFQMNSVEILVYLFENVFGPDFILKDNMTPFHLFAKYGQAEALSYCLKIGISPNFKTSIAY